MSAADERARYIDGLRVLASVLEQNPDVPLPLTGTGRVEAVSFTFWGGGARDAMAAAAKAIPCAWRKEVCDDDPAGRWPGYFDLLGQLGGLHIKMRAERDAVCRRVVTGSREVTEEVPDPDALAAVPTVKVTKTIETVDWDCGSLLSPVAARRAKALGAANGTAAAGDGGGR